jgi:hypothetical protein
MEISAGDYTAFVHEIDRNKPEAADCASFVLLLNPCDDVLEFAGEWYTFADDRPRTSGYIGIHIEHAPDLRGAAKCIQEVTDGIYSIIRDKIKSREPILIGNLHDPCASQLVVMMQKIIDGLAQQGVSFSYAIDAMLLTRDEFNDVLGKHGHARI